MYALTIIMCVVTSHQNHLGWSDCSNKGPFLMFLWANGIMKNSSLNYL